MNNNLKKFSFNLIKKNNSILTAIKILQKIKYKTLVVIDDHNKLIGTVTDGDIRRGMLNGFNLDTKINKITNKKPIKKFLTRDLIIKKNKEDIDLIPCVDKFNRIKDLEVLKNKSRNFLDNLEIVLMAGGYGKRLMPLTKKYTQAFTQN